MRLKVDRDADALYLTLDDSVVVESEEVSPGIIADYNAENQMVGIELLHLSKRAPNLNVYKFRFPDLAGNGYGTFGGESRQSIDYFCGGFRVAEFQFCQRVQDRYDRFVMRGACHAMDSYRQGICGLVWRYVRCAHQ